MAVIQCHASAFKGDRTLIAAGPLCRLLLLLRRSCAAAAATELVSSLCLLEVLPAARSWQRLEEGRDAQNDETTL